MANAAIFFEGQPVKLPVDLEDATLAKCFAEYLTKGKASSFGGKMKPGGGVIVAMDAALDNGWPHPASFAAFTPAPWPGLTW